MKVVKVFRQLTRADSISISRLGEEVRIPKFWSTFMLTDEGIGENVRTIADSLNTMLEYLEYAEPNLLFTLFDVPNDEHYGYQLSLHDEDSGINIEEAWDIHAGSWDIKVGVVDAVIFRGHDEFWDATMQSSKVTDGFDFASYTAVINIPEPNNNHGTNCAGIIGALRNNENGIAGIAGGDPESSYPDRQRGVQLISLGIVNDASNIIQAPFIAEAITMGALSTTTGSGFGCHALNNSYGRYAQDNESLFSPADLETLRRAVMVAYRNQCTFVASRGNNGTTNLSYPGCFLPETAVINVGASGNDGEWLYAHPYDPLSGFPEPNAWFDIPWASNYGDYLDLIAPGDPVSIVTTSFAPLTYPFPFNANYQEGYTGFNGTSASGPHVTGVAALLLSEHREANGAPNNLAPEDVEWILKHTATDIGASGPDEYTGHGRLNAGAALQAVHEPYCVVHSEAPDNVGYSEASSVQLTVLPGNDWSLVPGTYTAHLNTVIHQYEDEFGPNDEIEGWWGRASSTTGTHATTDADGSPWASYDVTIDGNSAYIDVTTYCWRILNPNFGGLFLPEWYFPAPPDEIRTAYSLHVYKGEGPVRVPENLIEPSIRIHPNPASDLVTITFEQFNNDNWTLELIDALGRITVIRNGLNTSRSKSMVLPVGHLAPGSYCFRFHHAAASHSIRFIKQ